MGFFTSMPSRPSAAEVSAQAKKGKVPHSQCEGRGKVNVGGNIIDCPGCKGKGFV